MVAWEVFVRIKMIGAYSEVLFVGRDKSQLFLNFLLTSSTNQAKSGVQLFFLFIMWSLGRKRRGLWS